MERAGGYADLVQDLDLHLLPPEADPPALATHIPCSSTVCERPSPSGYSRLVSSSSPKEVFKLKLGSSDLPSFLLLSASFLHGAFV